MIPISASEFENLNRDIDRLRFEFRRSGGFWVSDYSHDPNTFSQLASSLTIRKANDAARRTLLIPNGNFYSVDDGFDEMPLHSESSFTPTCPEHIMFLCLDSDADTAATTVCDGRAVWQMLPSAIKAFLLRNRIEYELSIELPRPVSAGAKKWFIDRLGAGDASISGKQLSFKYRRYAVNEVFDELYRTNLCFANHLFADLDAETQILSRRFEEDAPDGMLSELI